MTPGENIGGIMKKLFLLAIGATMFSGFALANTYDSAVDSSLDNEVYEEQSMEEITDQELREQEMRDDEIRRDELRRADLQREERINERYLVDPDALISDPVSGASAPRYNSDENSGYR